jgi:hypothetical protein
LANFIGPSRLPASGRALAVALLRVLYSVRYLLYLPAVALSSAVPTVGRMRWALAGHLQVPRPTDRTALQWAATESELVPLRTSPECSTAPAGVRASAPHISSQAPPPRPSGCSCTAIQVPAPSYSLAASCCLPISIRLFLALLVLFPTSTLLHRRSGLSFLTVDLWCKLPASRLVIPFSLFCFRLPSAPFSPSSTVIRSPPVIHSRGIAFQSIFPLDSCKAAF